MDRINTNNDSLPLSHLLPKPGAPAPTERPGYSVYGQDHFQRVRTRTPEQASGMKAFDAAAMISVASGAVGLLGGLGLAGGIFAGAFGGMAIAAAAAFIGGAGLLALFLGVNRYLARKKLLEEG